MLQHVSVFPYRTKRCCNKSVTNWASCISGWSWSVCFCKLYVHHHYFSEGITVDLPMNKSISKASWCEKLLQALTAFSSPRFSKESSLWMEENNATTHCIPIPNPESLSAQCWLRLCATMCQRLTGHSWGSSADGKVRRCRSSSELIQSFEGGEVSGNQMQNIFQ